MIKNLFLFLTCLSVCFSCIAQITPQYYIDNHQQGVGVPPYPNPVFTDMDIQQSLLAADSFKNNPPYGRMKNVYLRTGLNWKQQCKTYKLNISLGYTSMTNFDTCTRLFTNVMVIAKPDSMVMGDSVGDWMQIPLNGEDSFFFNPSQNLVLSLFIDSGAILNYCWFLGSFVDTIHYYYLQGLKSNLNVSSQERGISDFGFDLYPTGIEAVSNIEDVRVYPNPADEKCVVSFAVKKQVSSYSLSLKDVTGKELITEQYRHSTGNRFSKEIDVSQLPRGLYFIELRAGAEKIIRKVVLQ